MRFLVAGRPDASPRFRQPRLDERRYGEPPALANDLLNLLALPTDGGIVVVDLPTEFLNAADCHLGFLHARKFFSELVPLAPHADETRHRLPERVLHLA